MRWLILAVAAAALVGCMRIVYTKHTYDGRQYIIEKTLYDSPANFDQIVVYVLGDDGRYRAVFDSETDSNYRLVDQIEDKGTFLGPTDASALGQPTTSTASANKDTAAKSVGH